MSTYTSVNAGKQTDERSGLAASESMHRKLAARDVGLNAPRGCTNIPFLFVLLSVWIGMMVVAGVAIQNGDLRRLTHGTDYLGNVCGSGSPNSVSDSVRDSWGSRNALFFPITFNSNSLSFNIADALNFGVCLEECPSAGLGSTSTLQDYGLETPGHPDPFPSGLQLTLGTTLKYGRCLPNFASFDCNQTADVSKCTIERNSALGRVIGVLGLETTAMRSMAEVKENWWVILVSSLLCVVVAFAWMFVLRRLVKPVVVVTATLVFVLLITIGIVALNRRSASPSGSSAMRWYTFFGVMAFLFAFLYLCVGLYLRRDVMVACDIIEEASKIPVEMPTIVAVPPVIVCFVLPFAVFALLMAAEIHTSASMVVGGNRTVAPGSPPVETHEFEGQKWRTWGQILNVFVFLWSFGFVHAIGFMVISFCAVFWYWSNPGDEKHPSEGVATALALTVRNHLGTLALGSLIIAIIQTVRIVVTAFEKHMRRYAERSDAVACLMCCVQCCLAYLERFVQFINKNAYILTCMTGDSFLPSARHALQLLVRNALSVGAVNVVGEYVMLVGKLLITCVTLLIGYGILKSRTDSTSGMVVILVAIGILAYFIACVFINVFGVCIDTVLLSYCYDLEQNNGMDRPYFFPEDLKKHVARAESRAKETEVRQNLM